MNWGVLGCAILLEVAGTLSLQQASRSRKAAWYDTTAIAYVGAFGVLALLLRRGFPLGEVFLWALPAECGRGGAALTAVAAHYLFREETTKRMLARIVLIMVGVFLVESTREHL